MKKIGYYIADSSHYLMLILASIFIGNSMGFNNHPPSNLEASLGLFFFLSSILSKIVSDSFKKK